jgi:glycosyltransferase involved in cell wall biosynthesis
VKNSLLYLCAHQKISRNPLRMKKLRILAFFIHFQPHGKNIGGSTRRFLYLSKCLKKREVELYAMEYSPSLAELSDDTSYHPLTINERYKDHKLLSMLVLTIYGILSCIRMRCDLVYVPDHWTWRHSPYINLLPAFIVSRICRVPLVIVFHHFTPKFVLKHRPVQLSLMRQADCCIAVSQSTARDAEKYFQIRSKVSGNGVDLNLYKKSFKSGSESKLFDAAFLGRITADKGIFTLVESWKIVTAKLPSAQLLLIGYLDKDTLKSLDSYIKKLELEKNVTMTGFVADEEVVRLLNSSRIFMLPSIGEGFGLAIAEAMACGLPCIISNIPALRETFDSVPIFVEVGDSKAFAHAALTLLSNPEKLSELSRCSQRFVKSFSWENVAEKEFEFLYSIVNRKSNVICEC